MFEKNLWTCLRLLRLKGILSLKYSQWTHLIKHVHSIDDAIF